MDDEFAKKVSGGDSQVRERLVGALLVHLYVHEEEHVLSLYICTYMAQCVSRSSHLPVYCSVHFSRCSPSVSRGYRRGSDDP